MFRLVASTKPTLNVLEYLQEAFCVPAHCPGHAFHGPRPTAAHLELLDVFWPTGLQDVIVLLPCALPIRQSFPLQGGRNVINTLSFTSKVSPRKASQKVACSATHSRMRLMVKLLVGIHDRGNLVLFVLTCQTYSHIP